MRPIIRKDFITDGNRLLETSILQSEDNVEMDINTSGAVDVT
jgi:hypothetical protein